jgi:hypothetical protein
MGLCVAALWGGAALAGDDWKQPGYGGSGQDETRSMYRANEDKGADKGLYILLGGGTEGYTGANASELNPGFAYGATVGIRPWKMLGFELNYNGALNDIDTAGPGGVADGADIVRQGGQAAVTLGLTSTKLQPYVLGGIGIQNHNVRGAGPVFGFVDDTSGYVPAGVGLRYNMGKLLTADARVDYNIPFEQEFAPDNGIGDGRYQALLQIGGTY